MTAYTSRMLGEAQIRLLSIDSSLEGGMHGDLKNELPKASTIIADVNVCREGYSNDSAERRAMLHNHQRIRSADRYTDITASTALGR
nr:hypothetical protein CFP56_00480 [Quercus suber]